MLDEGRLVAAGTATELKRSIPGGHVQLQLPDAHALREATVALGAGASPDEKALSLQVPSDGSLAALRALIDRREAAAVPVHALSVHAPDLDDVFLTLTGRSTAAATPEDLR